MADRARAPATRPPHRWAATLVALLSLAAAPYARSQGAGNPTPVEVRSGTASFDVGTNMPALRVRGKSTALEAQVRVRLSPDGPRLEQIEAPVPVRTLLTGIVLRDEHMRKYIFAKDDRRMPDVRFVAGAAACAKVSANESTCRLAGDLVIRDVARPLN